MRRLICSLLFFSSTLGFVDVDDHNSRFVTRYNARQFQKIQEFLIDPTYASFGVNTNLYMGDFAYDGDIYAAIRDRLYANYSNLTNIYCIVSYKDSPTDLDTYNECTAYFKSGTALRFISNIWTIGNTSSGIPDNRFTFMSFSDPPPPPCTGR